VRTLNAAAQQKGVAPGKDSSALEKQSIRFNFIPLDCNESINNADKAK